MPRRKSSRLNRLGNAVTLSLVVAAVGSATFVYLRWRWREQRYNPLIAQVAAQYGVDPRLVKAVVRRESEFDPFAYGRAGEIGLMQVMPGAGAEWARATGRRDFGRDSLWNERINLEAGTWYLARALNRWRDKDDPVPFALAEYNAGPGRVARWLPSGPATTADEFRRAIPLPGVRRYVDTVMEFYEMYRADQPP
jgi:soluble lytic murein transglycosylase